jgi:hypothetical protein
MLDGDFSKWNPLRICMSVNQCPAS